MAYLWNNLTMTAKNNSATSRMLTAGFFFYAKLEKNKIIGRTIMLILSVNTNLCRFYSQYVLCFALIDPKTNLVTPFTLVW